MIFPNISWCKAKFWRLVTGIELYPHNIWVWLPTWILFIEHGIHLVDFSDVCLALLQQVLKVARRHLTQIAALEMLQDTVESLPQTNLLRMKRINVRLVRDFGVVWLCFALAWLPFSLLTFYIGLQDDVFAALDSVRAAYDLTVLAFMFNSLVNPFVYAIRFKTFKYSLKLIFCCLEPDKRQAYQVMLNEVVLWCAGLIKKNGQINTLRPRQNGQDFADDIFICIFVNENV